jgi:hypothetical protein
VFVSSATIIEDHKYLLAECCDLSIPDNPAVGDGADRAVEDLCSSETSCMQGKEERKHRYPDVR